MVESISLLELLLYLFSPELHGGRGRRRCLHVPRTNPSLPRGIAGRVDQIPIAASLADRQPCSLRNFADLFVAGHDLRRIGRHDRVERLVGRSSKPGQRQQRNHCNSEQGRNRKPSRRDDAAHELTSDSANRLLTPRTPIVRSASQDRQQIGPKRSFRGARRVARLKSLPTSVRADRSCENWSVGSTAAGDSVPGFPRDLAIVAVYAIIGSTILPTGATAPSLPSYPLRRMPSLPRGIVAFAPCRCLLRRLGLRGAVGLRRPRGTSFGRDKHRRRYSSNAAIDPAAAGAFPKASPRSS